MALLLPCRRPFCRVRGRRWIRRENEPRLPIGRSHHFEGRVRELLPDRPMFRGSSRRLLVWKRATRAEAYRDSQSGRANASSGKWGRRRSYRSIRDFYKHQTDCRENSGGGRGGLLGRNDKMMSPSVCHRTYKGI